MSKSLSVLLNLKKEKNEFVVMADNGAYGAMSVGSKGTVREIDQAIAHELFGEYPLSDQNHSNFIQLTKMKLPKVKKPKEEKTSSSSESKLKTMKNAGIV